MYNMDPFNYLKDDKKEILLAALKLIELFLLCQNGIFRWYFLLIKILVHIETVLSLKKSKSKPVNVQPTTLKQRNNKSKRFR